MPNRISPRELRQIRQTIFEQTGSPAALAASVRMSYNTLWVNFNRNGLTPDVARRLARKLRQWAYAIAEAAEKLETLANMENR